MQYMHAHLVCEALITRQWWGALSHLLGFPIQPFVWRVDWLSILCGSHQKVVSRCFPSVISHIIDLYFCREWCLSSIFHQQAKVRKNGLIVTVALEWPLRTTSDCTVSMPFVSALLRYEEDETSPGVCDHLNAGLYSYIILSRSFAVPKAAQQTVAEWLAMITLKP